MSAVHIVFPAARRFPVNPWVIAAVAANVTAVGLALVAIYASR
jgi:hypothetical protein